MKRKTTVRPMILALALMLLLVWVSASYANNRFIDNGDGTITDTKTGFMWTKADSYANTFGCLDWNGAKRYVSGLKTGGYSDWEMPSVQMLKDLYDKSKTNITYTLHGKIHIDPIFEKGGAYWYWSNEQSGSCCARYVSFVSGYIGARHRDYCSDVGVRAVRLGH
ncbi:MAG: DUF1566 domain-containing protein [Nitrospirae bacterium]|nr:DUF1566 domain-containing protein [Nitrospirota bacterium]MBF0541552.1 DUF1566 domain-containing protein [Nitrospirota bacterium]